MLTFYSTRLARQKFYLEKKLSSESSRVKFKNGIHSTRSSFHCFISSEFRVLVEYFWRSIVIFKQLQKMFCPIICNIIVVANSPVFFLSRNISMLAMAKDSNGTEVEAVLINVVRLFPGCMFTFSSALVSSIWILWEKN